MSRNLLINLYDKINPNTDSIALTANTISVLYSSILDIFQFFENLLALYVDLLHQVRHV